MTSATKPARTHAAFANTTSSLDGNYVEIDEMA
jgi:hypothetical protein